MRFAWARHLPPLRARVGALLLDTLLIDYALWCVTFLQERAGATGLLTRYPGLLLVAPFLAIPWQTTGTSLGLRGYRLRLLGRAGQPANPAARRWWGVGAGVQLAITLAPLAALGGSGSAMLAAAVLAGGWGLAALLARDGRSLPERRAGVELSLARTAESGPVVSWVRRPNAWIVLGMLGLTFAVGAEVTRFSTAALLEGAGRTSALWDHLFSPDWSITGQVVERLIETVFLALMASSLALPCAFFLSFLGARNLTRGSVAGRVAYGVTRVLMNLTRSIEPLVWAIIFVLWVGVGPFAGMLALFVHSVAALGKLYSEAIESIDAGPVEAITATGASFVQVLRYGVVPQVVPPFLSFTVYRWDINVRMATILGLVGGGGIGDLLINYQQLGAWSKVGTIIVFITLVVWMMDVLSAKVRERWV